MTAAQTELTAMPLNYMPPPKIELAQMQQLFAIEERGPDEAEEARIRQLMALIELDNTRRSRYYADVKERVGGRRIVIRKKNETEVQVPTPSYVRFKADPVDTTIVHAGVCTGKDVSDETNWHYFELKLATITAAIDPALTGDVESFANDFRARMKAAGVEVYLVKRGPGRRSNAQKAADEQAEGGDA